MSVKSSEISRKRFIFENDVKYVLNKEFHRIDGPAIIYGDGEIFWFKKGKRHREDGPAVIHVDGSMYWYQKNKLHNTNGPAIVLPNGYEEWFYWGVSVDPILYKNKSCKLVTFFKFVYLLLLHIFFHKTTPS